MKKLKKRTELLLLVIVLCMIFTGVAHVYHKTQWIFLVSIIVNILVMCLFLGLLSITYKRLITAKLIIDNQILFFEQAQVITEGRGILMKSSKRDVYISCFGILSGQSVVKYNLREIRLKSVRLGEEDISITYGTEQREKKIRILHERMRVQDMIRITEQFRYETGITPILTDE